MKKQADVNDKCKEDKTSLIAQMELSIAFLKECRIPTSVRDGNPTVFFARRTPLFSLTSSAIRLSSNLPARRLSLFRTSSCILKYAFYDFCFEFQQLSPSPGRGGLRFDFQSSFQSQIAASWQFRAHRQDIDLSPSFTILLST